MELRNTAQHFCATKLAAIEIVLSFTRPEKIMTASVDKIFLQ